MGDRDIQGLADRMKEVCKQKPFFFYDLLKAFKSVPYRVILMAWGHIREQLVFERDEEGRYIFTKEQ